MKDKPQKAIAHKDELQEEQLAGKHIDGATGFVFETEEDYLAFKHPEEVPVPDPGEGDAPEAVTDNGNKEGKEKEVKDK